MSESDVPTVQTDQVMGSITEIGSITPIFKKVIVSHVLQLTDCPLYSVLRDLGAGVHGLAQTAANQGNVLIFVEVGQDGLKELKRKGRQ